MNLPSEVVDEFAAQVAALLAPKVIVALGRVSLSSGSPTPAWALVGVDEVAAVLGRSKRWVHGAVKERGLPFIRLDGGALAFDLEDVRGWALDRRVPALDVDSLAGGLRAPRNPRVHRGSRVADLTGTQKVRP